MDVEDLVGDRAEGVNNEGADGDVRDEAPVHHIDVDPLRTGIIDGLNLSKRTAASTMCRNPHVPHREAAREHLPRFYHANPEQHDSRCDCRVPGGQPPLTVQRGTPREPFPTCSPSLAKLAERMDGETMMLFLSHLSTRAVAWVEKVARVAALRRGATAFTLCPAKDER